MAVMQLQRHLYQAGHPCGGIQMADVGFHRANAASAHGIGGFAEGLGQGCHFDGVAQIGAGAVTFDVSHRVRINARNRLRLGDAAGLAVNRRGQIARFGGTVVVYGRSFDDRPDMIAVADGILGAAQNHTARARAKHRASGAVVEGVAMAVGG